MSKLASQADPCYNVEAIKYVFAPALLAIARGVSQFCFGELTMDTIHPHGLFQQAFSFNEPASSQEQKTCTGPCGRTLPATLECFYSHGKQGFCSQCKQCMQAKLRKPHEVLPEGHKRCLGECSRILPATTEFFHKAPLGKYGMNSKCKECVSEERKRKNPPKPPIVSDTPEGRKKCTGPCGLVLPATIEYFQRNKKTKDGLQHRCKECRQAKRRKPPVVSDVPEGYKRCTGPCKQILPATLEFFHHCASGKYGFQSYCKKCTNDARRKPPVVSDIPEGHKRCPQCKRILAATAKFFHRSRKAKNGVYSICKDCYNPQNRARVRAYQKIYQRRPENYERLKEYSRNRWRNRYIRSKGVSGTHTPEQIRDQLKRQKGRCYYAACGHAKFEKVNDKYIYHIEHTYPVSRVAGTDIPANSIDYLVLACPACNRAKGNKFPWEFPEGGRLF
jgi:hypothetical protein